MFKVLVLGLKNLKKNNFFTDFFRFTYQTIPEILLTWLATKKCIRKELAIINRTVSGITNRILK